MSPDGRTLIIGYQGQEDRGSNKRLRVVTVDVDSGISTEILDGHTIGAISPEISHRINSELLFIAGLLLTGIGLFRW